jgi:hypothetical protein
MIYFVYLDPQVIVESHGEGTLSIETLTSILNNLAQNCLLADFDNFDVQNGIRASLLEITGDFEIARLKKALAHFQKNDLFVNCLVYDYASTVSLAAMACDQRETSNVDFFIVPKIEYEPISRFDFVGTLDNFYASAFDEKRRRSAVEGIELGADELDEMSFMNDHLFRPLKFATRIDIIDRQCGENYKDNYDYTIERFLRWLSSTNTENPAITFHLGFPGVRQSTIITDDDLKGIAANDIESIKIERLLCAIKRHLPAADIRVRCYDGTFSHQRYIVTNQLGFSIDMGMDFLNPSTRKNRKVSISLKPGREILSKLPTPSEILQ